MATTKQTEPVREEILEFVRKTEETVTEAGRKLGETVCDLMPNDGDGIRKVVDEAFDLTETILKSQRDFATSLLDSILGAPSPKRRQAAKPKATQPKATTPKATKPAAKRPARKVTKHAGAA